MDIGLENKFIDRVLFKKDPYFIGVNNLPAHAHYKPFSTVMNCSGHFIALVGDNRMLYYYDPIGLTIFDDEVRRFCSVDPRKFIKISQMHQHPKSISCGFFVIMFILCKRFKFRLPNYDKNNLWKNDNLVVKSLIRILPKITKNKIDL